LIITLKEITIRDLVEGYADSADLGVRAYSGKLDVRPAYQRAFVYKEDKRTLSISQTFSSCPGIYSEECLPSLEGFLDT
jgi:hypothetical protein